MLVPGALKEKLADAVSDGLGMMFAEAHKIAVESFERRLAEETMKLREELRLDMANLKFDVVKWNFVFWIGQLAAMTGILSLMLRDLR